MSDPCHFEARAAPPCAARASATGGEELSMQTDLDVKP